MRTKSVYCVTCLCGASIESRERETTCGKCGRILVLNWRIGLNSDPEPRTISEEYER